MSLGKWWSGFDRNYRLLLMAFFFVGLTGGLYDPIFNNYLNDVFHLSAEVRGYLEFPREFPGFSVALLSGILVFLADVRLAALALSLLGLGLIGQSFAVWGGTPSFGWMITSMLLWSVGNHLFMPLSSSISVQMSNQNEIGKSLGRLNGASTAAYILGCLLIWWLMGKGGSQYEWMFRLAGFFGLAAMCCLFLIKPPASVRPAEKVRLVFRRKYSLFYWLSVLFGVRKQVFLTFAPWVLVKVYGEKPSVIATLFLTASIIGIVFKPWLGKLIDRVGERKILTAEAFVMIFVCLGYGYAGRIFSGSYGIYIIYLCFILDQLLFAAGMARTTYINKRLVLPTDLTPTLSLGITLDHAAAMTVPILGGILWEKAGFEAIFLVAALVSLINFLVAGRIGREKHLDEDCNTSEIVA